MATHAPITGAPTRAPIIPLTFSDLSRFCDDHGISPSAFGRRAVGDPRLLGDLRAGRQLRPTTAARVTAALAAMDTAPPTATIPPLPLRPAMPRLTPPIALLRALPPGPLARKHQRLKRLARLFAKFDRADMETAVSLLLAEMDARDGDADLEPNGDDEGPGTLAYSPPKEASQLVEHRDAAIALETEDDEADGDEQDGLMSEDDFMVHGLGSHHEPGCPISDVGEYDGTELGDLSWIEWQTRGRHKIERFGSEIVGRDRYGNLLREDAEDDDPPEANGDERDVNGDEADSNDGEDEMLTAVAHRYAAAGPGCVLSDPGGGAFANHE